MNEYKVFLCLGAPFAYLGGKQVILCFADEARLK